MFVDRAAQYRSRFRREPIVDRQRGDLVFDDDAGCDHLERLEAAAQRVRQRCGLFHRCVGLHAEFGAMAADGRKPQRREQPIHGGERPARQECGGAVRGVVEAAEHLAHAFRDFDAIRRRREIEQGPVYIEEQRGVAKIDLQIGVVHCSRTSTIAKEHCQAFRPVPRIKPRRRVQI